MSDTVSFNKMNPNYQHFTEVSNNVMFIGGGNRSTTGAVQTIPEESYYRTWPTVGGFSFSMKKWGEIVIDRCSDVVFDDKAFERLVLPAEKKRLIKALIMHTNQSVADIITGKGGGCIFALHGPPGTGKTVTAESIAELLHRPLYSISVGELGTTTESLEKGLRDILEVASAWNAVILIDEADVFLEQRRDSDIQRNAMVGVFLRLLEYHQGVLFLTTNRVHTFDEAFHSRISVALHYPELDADARRKIWVNFIDAAGVKTFSAAQIDSLAQHRLNGRQIRNVVRLAQALARDDNLDNMTMRHLEETIAITLQFLPAPDSVVEPNRKLKISSNGVVFTPPAAQQ
jgi:SpoVK/Ycf46/Vps4 family AAA+-type ATPase